MTEPSLPTRDELAVAAEIDVEILKRWFEIGDNSHIELVATRTQMDALFLGLRHMLFSQGAALAALGHYSRGETDQGNAEYAGAARTHLEALSTITRWTGAMMAQAKPHG